MASSGMMPLMIPDDTVDRRKLGFQILIFTIVLDLIWTFNFLNLWDLLGEFV